MTDLERAFAESESGESLAEQLRRVFFRRAAGGQGGWVIRRHDENGSQAPGWTIRRREDQ